MEYKEWNKILVDHFFNSTMAAKEVHSLQLTPVLLNAMVIGGYDSYLQAIKESIPVHGRFFDELSSSISASREQRRTSPTEPPVYFGLLVFLVLACAVGEDEDLNLNNVYDRMNRFAVDTLGQEKWGDIKRIGARNLVAEAWADLQQWTEINDFKYGRFVHYTNVKRPYANAIFRHVLINQGHLDNIIDVLVDNDIIPGDAIGKEAWLTLLMKNKETIKAPTAFYEAINSQDEFGQSLLEYLGDYVQENFTDRVVASEVSTHRKPAIPLRLSVAFSKFSNRVHELYVRAYSHDLLTDELNLSNGKHDIGYENAGYSNKISLPLHYLVDGLVYNSNKKQRFKLVIGTKWLTINRELGEWIEVSRPDNSGSFSLVCSNIYATELKTRGIKYTSYDLGLDGIVLLKFPALALAQYEVVLQILGMDVQDNGRVNLEGAFVSDRRTTIIDEFPYRFSYAGYVDHPNLVAVANDNVEIPLEKNTIEVKGEAAVAYWRVPQSLMGQEFKVKETISSAVSHLYYTLEKLAEPTLTTSGYLVKDKQGNFVQVNPIGLDDLPGKVYDNITAFNTYYFRLIKFFLKGEDDFRSYDKAINSNYQKRHLGDLLLKYVSDAANRTDNFQYLLQQVDSTLPKSKANRVMYQWRSLGYIDYEDFGKPIKVNDSTLYFMPYHGGILAYLTGVRNNTFIDELKRYCSSRVIDFIVDSHSKKYPGLFPQKIMLFSRFPDKDKFIRLCEHFKIKINVNEIYQLRALYYQQSLDEYIKEVQLSSPYQNDHRRKQVFNVEKMAWEETLMPLEEIVAPALIKYDGFKDNSLEFVFKINSVVVQVRDYSLALLYLFRERRKRVIFSRFNREHFCDLLVYSNIPLPYWLEKAIVLCTASNPFFENEFRVYERIPVKIVDFIAIKLKTPINHIHHD